MHPEWVKLCLCQGLGRVCHRAERGPLTLLASCRASIFIRVSPALKTHTVSIRHWYQLYSVSRSMLSLHCYLSPPAWVPELTATLSHLQPMLGSCFRPWPDFISEPFLFQGKWLQPLWPCLHLTYSRFCLNALWLRLFRFRKPQHFISFFSGHLGGTVG